MNQVIVIVNYDDDVSLPDDICDVLAEVCSGESVTDVIALCGHQSATWRREEPPSLTVVRPG